jgi:hypothetical protein
MLTVVAIVAAVYTLSSLSIILVFSLARQFTPRRSRQLEATALMALWPSMVLFSTQMMKDPMVIFLWLAFFWSAFALLRRPGLNHAVTLAVSIVLLTVFRVYLGLAALGAFGLLAGATALRDWRRLGAAAAGLAGCGAGLNALGYGWFGWKFVARNLALQRLQAFREAAYAKGTAALDVGVAITTPADALAYLPLGSAYVLLAPFPWQWFIGSGLIQKLNAPEMIVWCAWVIPTALLGFAALARRGDPRGWLALLAIGIAKAVIRRRAAAPEIVAHRPDRKSVV